MDSAAMPQQAQDFVQIGAYYKALNICVPTIFVYDDERHWLLMSDLGEQLLESVSVKNQPLCYQAALATLATFSDASRIMAARLRHVHLMNYVSYQSLICFGSGM